ncbi:unnamed protein product [Rotaria magnacalcarata]|uniref:Uncharacterized protein n=1 Tax=Rotaria magnacalcarata TaxID=392030 RepID=A0A815R831_9BILA|nr:unnamed protein product [Rotaria magnacalcarata]CAF1525507.1 unnamed protein product [Rotaria magnacalcarata]CAF2102667.1 unnamed protein product [Rotaria magnacalcarata]CAF3817181.1 unnamed protein product [Rotaria magnacalcarata]CAF3819880.1 unnamed protein product [Rotaria magnacalcarata]
MKIDHTQLQEKPIAFIEELSNFPEESEVMLPMGIVLRVESCRKMDASSDFAWEIQMIRGEDEVKLEQQLSRIPGIVQTGAGVVFVGAGIFSSLRDNSQHTGLIPTHEQLPSAAVNSNPSTSVQNTNISSTTGMQLNIREDPVSTSNMGTRNEQNNSPINVEQPSVTPHVVNATSIASIAAVEQSLMSVITLFIVITSTVAAICMVAGSITVSRFGPITTVCPHITCTTFSSVLNPSSNYQVEHLDFNCSQSLINMTILQVVQRGHNETNAQQYQTFWNSSTNMTFVQTLTEIIYTWYSLPGMYIVEASFPHFVEAQFYYTSGSTRVTSNDTWQIWAQSSCREFIYLYGTF